jgi:hypothetical protein
MRIHAVRILITASFVFRQIIFDCTETPPEEGGVEGRYTISADVKGTRYSGTARNKKETTGPTINNLKIELFQYCGSGSGIRCIFDPWIRDPE